jgi:hypothetical protein
MITVKLRLETTVEIVAGWLGRQTEEDGPLLRLPWSPDPSPYWLIGAWAGASPHYCVREIEAYRPTEPHPERIKTDAYTYVIRIVMETVTPTTCQMTLTCTRCHEPAIVERFQALLAGISERWPQAESQIPTAVSYQDGWGITHVVSLRSPQPSIAQAATAGDETTLPEPVSAPKRGGRQTNSDAEMLHVYQGWRAAKAERRLSQEAYANEIGVSAETIRRYGRILKGKNLIK